MAETALAQTTSSFGLVQPQGSLETAKAKLLGIQPKSYLGLRLLPFSAPSLEDISTLESTLSDYKAQLATLKSQAASSNKDLSAPIAALSNKISAYESAIATAKADYATYLSAQNTLRSVVSRYESSLLAQQQAQTAKDDAQRLLDEAKATLEAKQAIKSTAQSTLDQAQQAYDAAQKTFNEADAALTQQKEITTRALGALTLNQALATQAAADLQSAQQTLDEAQQSFNTAANQLETANQALVVAQQKLQTAQHNYDNNLIPDPNWIAPTQQVAHTRLVPNTTTRIDTQIIPNILFNSDFSQGTSGWSGVYAGEQGSNPDLINGVVTFSYMNQTVSQGLFSGPFQNATLTLSADWSNNDLNRNFTDVYSMTIEARDINQNPVGTATYNSTGSHAWETKSVSLTATGPVSYITVSFTGIDSGYWYGTYGPSFKNPTLKISYGQEITETTYTEETYYTTEPVLTEGTQTVDIGEGGQATFNAPAGATFTGSNLRYESYNNPTCGRSVTPQNLAGATSITLKSLNSVWGDTCPGQRKHLVGTLTYLGQPTAPLIKDPALLGTLNEAQSEYDSTLLIQQGAQSSYDEALLTKNSATTAVETATAELHTINEEVAASTITYNTELAKSQEGEVTLNESVKSLTAAEGSKTTATSALDQAITEVSTNEQTVTTATSQLEEATTSHEEAVTATAAALTSKTVAETKLEAAQTSNQESIQKAKVYTEEIPVTLNEVKTELNKPDPVPEEGSKEIPVELSAENLMDVNLDAVDPTELTEAQAEQLVAAALETFETATEGSPEYQQALDALYLAAEQDDIVLDPALAAIPGLQAATELINFFGNAGADMSPKKREESKKVVVTAVVAAGAAIQAAAGAATSAATSTSASSGGSSRKIK